jgi:hypothetical protein
MLNYILLLKRVIPIFFLIFNSLYKNSDFKIVIYYGHIMYT